MLRGMTTKWLHLICCGVLVLGLGAASAEVNSSSINALLDRGNQAMRGGDFRTAAQYFQRVTQAAPSFGPGYFSLGLAFEQAGRYRRAERAFEIASHLSPGLRGVNLFYGINEYHLNQFVLAEKLLRKATLREPHNAMAWMWLGVNELAESKPDAAADALDKAAAIDPNNVDIEYHRGRAHLLVSQQSYEAMFKANPNSWRVHEVLGQADVAAYRSQLAIQEFQQAIAASPQEPGLHEELGDAEWQAGQMDAADHAYAEELKVDPQDAIAMYKLGALRVTVGQTQSGIQLLKQSLRLDPTIKSAHYYLGKGYIASGAFQKAVDQLKIAATSSTEEELRIMSWYQLAAAYRRLHDTADMQNALQIFEKLHQQRSERQEQKFVAARNRESIPVPEKGADSPM
jgi:tetratricopeptide (TPR) repeat protein